MLLWTYHPNMEIKILKDLHILLYRMQFIISAQLALKIGKFLGTSAEYWCMQPAYDLQKATLEEQQSCWVNNFVYGL